MSGSKQRSPASSSTFSCLGGRVALSPNGRLYATKSKDEIVISCCTTLLALVAIPVPDEVSVLSFSTDSKHLSWLNENPQSVNLYEIETRDRLEIDVKPGLSVVRLIWGPNCLLYVSELEVYIGVYDLRNHHSFTLEGCSVDDFNRPILRFSPFSDYLVYLKDHRLVVYYVESWQFKTTFDCLVNPTAVIFVNPYTIFESNGDGVTKWTTILGLTLKTGAEPPSSHIVGVLLSADGRTLFASKYDNKIASYDTISMRQTTEFEYIYDLKSDSGVRVDVMTDETEDVGRWKLQKFIKKRKITLKAQKNIVDEFKSKTNFQHFMSLNADNTMLATVNPSTPNTIWIWDLTRKRRLVSVVQLVESAGRVQGLTWHSRANKLAVSCSGLVVIWSQKGTVSAFPGDKMKFKWLSGLLTVGVIISNECGRFVYLDC